MSTTMTSMCSESGRPHLHYDSRLFSRTCRTRSDTPVLNGALRNLKEASVAAVRQRVAEGPGALVAEEVVAREDVIDLQALRAGVALADVALQERVVVDDTAALAVVEQGPGGASPARLAGGRWRHPPRPSRGSGQQQDNRKKRGTQRVYHAGADPAGRLRAAARAI